MPADIIVEYLVNDIAYGLENIPAVDVILVVPCVVGDIEIISSGGVPFGVYAVERKGDYGVKVCSQGGFGPCGIKLAGAYVFDVVHEIHRNVHGAPVIGCAKMYGYLFGNKGFSCHLLLLLRCYPTEGESVMLLSELFLGCMPPYSGRGIRSMGCTVFTPAKMGIFMSLMV